MPEPLAWRPTNAEGARRYDDIWFQTPELGWAVNSNGQILQTADGGTTWEEQFHDDMLYLRCIGFASDSRGWMGTLVAGRQLFETHDGGASWSQVTNLPPLAPSAVCGLSVVNESVVYASGTNYPFPARPDRPPRMMRTVAGRVGLENLLPHRSGGLHLPGELLRGRHPQTTDGGQTWKRLEINDPQQNANLESARPVRIDLTVPPGAAQLTITIWERFGDLVRRLVDEPQPAAGSRTVEWDVTNDAGEPLDLGNFILRATVDGHSESQIILITG